MSAANYIGERFGQLEIVGSSESNRHGKRWVCKCDCGKTVTVNQSNLRSGGCQTCGCSKLKHGYSDRPVWLSWKGMIARCCNPNDPEFANYGGRGITVCERWRNDFKAFLDDMGDRPEGKTLDRKDNNAGYSPENCRWATPKEQGRNTRCSRLITWNGRTQCVVEWAEEIGISPPRVYQRLEAGWTVERALTTPVRAKRRSVRNA